MDAAALTVNTSRRLYEAVVHYKGIAYFCVCRFWMGLFIYRVWVLLGFKTPVLSKNERCLVNRVTCTVKPNQSLGKVVLHRGEEACWTGYSKQSIFGWMCPAQVIMQMDLQMSRLPGKKCITIAFSTIYSSSWWLWDALHSDQQEEGWSHWLA